MGRCIKLWYNLDILALLRGTSETPRAAPLSSGVCL